MFKKTKKLISITFALIMVFAMSTSVFAADSDVFTDNCTAECEHIANLSIADDDIVNTTVDNELPADEMTGMESGVQPYGAFCWMGIHSWGSESVSSSTTSRSGYCYYYSTTYKKSCDCGETSYRTEYGASRLHTFNSFGGYITQNGRTYKIMKCGCGASITEPV